MAGRAEKTEAFKKDWNFGNDTCFTSYIMKKHFFMKENVMDLVMGQWPDEWLGQFVLQPIIHVPNLMTQFEYKWLFYKHVHIWGQTFLYIHSISLFHYKIFGYYPGRSLSHPMLIKSFYYWTSTERSAAGSQRHSQYFKFLLEIHFKPKLA